MHPLAWLAARHAPGWLLAMRLDVADQASIEALAHDLPSALAEAAAAARGGAPREEGSGGGGGGGSGRVDMLLNVAGILHDPGEKRQAGCSAVGRFLSSLSCVARRRR